jgi:hydrogenase nickel incorporation protein HypA/HybF
MHELSLADAIVTVARNHARGRRVLAVDVHVGRLRQVVPDALAFAFELVATGTNVEGAALRIHDVAACVRCGACDVESDQHEFPFACPSCGSLAVEVIAGEELLVDALELEDEPLAVRR